MRKTLFFNNKRIAVPAQIKNIMQGTILALLVSILSISDGWQQIFLVQNYLEKAEEQLQQLQDKDIIENINKYYSKKPELDIIIQDYFLEKYNIDLKLLIKNNNVNEFCDELLRLKQKYPEELVKDTIGILLIENNFNYEKMTATEILRLSKFIYVSTEKISPQVARDKNFWLSFFKTGYHYYWRLVDQELKKDYSFVKQAVEINPRIFPIAIKEGSIFSENKELLEIAGVNKKLKDINQKLKLADSCEFVGFSSNEYEFIKILFQKEPKLYQRIGNENIYGSSLLRKQLINDDNLARIAIEVYGPAIVGCSTRLQQNKILRELALQKQLKMIFNIEDKEIINKFVKIFDELDILLPARISDQKRLKKIIENRLSISAGEKIKGKNITLLFYPRSDYNDAFLTGNMGYGPIAQHCDHQEIIYYEISSEKKFIEIYQKVLKKQNVDTLWLGGHGYIDKITYGPDKNETDYIDLTDYKQFKKIPIILRKKITTIVLESCSTGQNGDNMAKMFKKIFPNAKIYAPKNETSIIKLEYDKNDKITWVEYRGEAKDALVLFPNKD